MFPPFLAPDAHHCDIQIGHLQPKENELKKKSMLIAMETRIKNWVIDVEEASLRLYMKL